MERWLHQHIFKVGWLVTKQYQTTTILYYAFFLPGILLHELVYWLMAGFLNVRAERAIAWPEKQEVGQLKLNFIRLSKNTGEIRLAIISAAPLLAGLAVVGFIANNILDFQGLTATMSGGFLEDIGLALRNFTAATDFWIWIYIVFTVSNTMMPDSDKLRGWRIIAGIVTIIVVGIFLLSGGSPSVIAALQGPVTNALNALSGTLIVIIFIDLFMVGVLGTVEAIIERITGDSATFKDGKMITMRREELLKQQAEARAAARQKKAIVPAAPAGPPTIYRLPLPIPGAPGKEAVTHDEGRIIAPAPSPALSPGTTAPVRSQPSVITGTASEKPAVEIRPSTLGAGVPSPVRPALSSPSKPDADDDIEDDEDDMEVDLDDEDDSDDEIRYVDLDEPA